MNNNTVIVDIQGFKNSDNEFIVKELAIATQEHTYIFLVKPPYPFNSLTAEEKKQVRWIERNRGYRWSEGYVDYREFQRIIKPYLKDKNICVKGDEKINWVQDLCGKENTVLDISYLSAPNLNTLCKMYCSDNTALYNCIYHKKICALKNVICIKKWCIENKVNL